jgi:hypothetical protein
MNERIERQLSPFPGMDPFLEAPDIWSDFHDRLASVISEMLNAQLPEPYYSRLQMRPEMGVILEAGTLRHIVPDVVLVRHPTPAPITQPPDSGGTAVLAKPRTQITPGVKVRIRTDSLRHQFVEIRDAARNHKLITLIEIISPSNKSPGPDRRAYTTKQRDVLDSDVNLIELDLLRGGRRLLPYPDLEQAVHQLACDYLILINRHLQRVDAWIDYVLYPVSLRESLPCIPVPLAGDDPDVPLDLQIVLQQIYQRALYLRMLDYALPPEPPLSDQDAAWADELLRAAGLRGQVRE